MKSIARTQQEEILTKGNSSIYNVSKSNNNNYNNNNNNNNNNINLISIINNKN